MLGRVGSFAGDMDDATFTRWAYRILLQREPDDGGRALYLQHLADGTRTRQSMLEEMRASDEFWFGFALRYDDPIFSLHRSRSLFVQSFPQAAAILDLGGTHQMADEGALVRLGYPYDFERLVIVDLPSEDRHELYRDGAASDRVDTPRGPVEYAFHSMADLSPYPDGSFDLVYSGQTIEHVPEPVADDVIAETYRVLRPGGWFCLDTPNGRLCRLQLEGSDLAGHEPRPRRRVRRGAAAGEAGGGWLRDHRGQGPRAHAGEPGDGSVLVRGARRQHRRVPRDRRLLPARVRVPEAGGRGHALRRVMAATIGSARFTRQRRPCGE